MSEQASNNESANRLGSRDHKQVRYSGPRYASYPTAMEFHEAFTVS